MGFRFDILFSLSCGLLCMAAEDQRVQPMVAFMCNKPAVHMTEDGWVEDRTTDCIQEPKDILEYCKKIYPRKEITNIVEGNELVTIDNWCGFDASKCHHHNQHTVRPFRCLEGPFQSDALLVPEHCVFDHKHGSQCARYMEWNHTATLACDNNNMRLASFAMLQPCLPEVNLFNGVEFVCCPRNSPTTGDNAFIVEDDSNLAGIADNDPSFWKPAPKDPNAINTDNDPNAILPRRKNPNTYTENTLSQKEDYSVKKALDDDVYAKYTSGQESDDRFANEHEYFLKAKGDMQKHHHDRVASMMKDWAAARQRVADLKVIDPNGADQLEKEITGRFQKTYEALEQEGMEEKQQLTAIHQQHVQKQYNDKKRDAMEHYMEVLMEDKPDSSVILKALRSYIKTEEKDRMHTLNHYRHVQEAVVEDEDDKDEQLHAVETIREQALNHMDIVNTRIQQAIDMLSRVPKLEEKIRNEIADYMETYSDLDEVIAKTLLQLPDTSEPEVLMPGPVISEQAQTYEQIGDDLLDRVEKEDDRDFIQPKEETFVDNDYRVPLNGNGYGISTFDDEVEEDESDLRMPEKTYEAKRVQHVDNIRNDQLDVKVMRNPKVRVTGEKSTNSVYSASTTAGIAVAAVAVFVILVVGGLLLKRNNSNRSTRGFIAVDTNASPEERHVANMQMNGYENPTYKYFEMGTGGKSA